MKKTILTYTLLTCFSLLTLSNVFAQTDANRNKSRLNIGKKPAESTAATLTKIPSSLDRSIKLRPSAAINAYYRSGLRTVMPWDREAVLRSVRKTSRCIVVHEDNQTCGFGAEIAATIAQEAFTHLDAPVQRLTTPDIPIPYNLTLMEGVVPTVETIKERIGTVMRF